MAGRTLATLIQSRRDDIIAAWLERVLGRPESLYRQRPAEQVASWLGTGIDVVLNSLSTGSEEGLEAHASALGVSRQRLGFHIDEVVDALLLLKEVVARMVFEAWEDDPRLRNEAAAMLDHNLRSLVSGFTAHFADALREHEQRLSALEERQHLARELHDAVSQSLYAVHLHAGASRRLLAGGDTAGATDNLEHLEEAAHHALADMRLLIFELRPSTLPEHGLEQALRARLAAVETRAGVATSCDIDPELKLHHTVQEAFHGLAREALNNALRHSEARKVSLSLKMLDEKVVLSICDDGCGFDPSVDHGGLGFTGMRERAAELGAELKVSSEPGKGAEIRISLPVTTARGDEGA